MALQFKQTKKTPKNKPQNKEPMTSYIWFYTWFTEHTAGPQHLPERSWEGARLFPRKGWVGVSCPLALPGCLSNPPGCTLSISETSAPAHFQLSHVPCRFFSLYKSSLSCACLAIPCLVLLAAGLPCSDSPCLQSPRGGRTLWGASASPGSRELCWHMSPSREGCSSLVSEATHHYELGDNRNSQLGIVTF